MRLILKSFLIVLTFFVLGQATDVIDESAQELTQQKDELLGTLTDLVGKKEKVVDKTGDVKVKINDLKDAIKILENKNERTKVVKTLSALALLKQEAEKKQGSIEYISSKITEAIEIISEAVINSVKLLPKGLVALSEQVEYLKTDEGYRSNTFILIMILLTSLAAATIAELTLRRFFSWTQSVSHEDFYFTKIHLHLVRNTAPVILFGLIGYIMIHFSQPEYNIITYRGYIVMNSIMMIRTMWLLIKVLFAPKSKATDITISPGFQFVLAGIQTIVIGVLFAQVGYFMGMRELAIDTWLKIIGFGVTSLIIIAIHRNKYKIQSYFKPDDEKLTGASLAIAKFTEFIFKKSPSIVSAAAIISYILWIFDLNLIAQFIAAGLLKTVIFMTLFIVGRDRIYYWLLRNKDVSTDQAQPITSLNLSYLQGSSTNILQLIWHALFLLCITDIWGADPFEIAASPDVHPYISKVVSIAIILVIIRTLWGWSDHIAKNYIRGRVVGNKIIESSQFVKTVTPILNSIAHWILAIMAIILILVEFGQDVRPMLYSLGVIGIAISLGAQSLVKDIINGILTLMEGNIAVGEVVTIAGNTGTVESLSLRSLVLRHPTGALQTIPFSEVTNIINKSRDYTSYGVSFTVPHRTDPARAIDLLHKTFDDIKQDPEFGKMILANITLSGVDQISDIGIVLSGTIRIKPDPANRFGRAFNKYLQRRMEEADLYPPPAQRVVNLTE